MVRKIIFMPIGREACFDELVGEVFYFAVEEAVGFLYRDIHVAFFRICIEAVFRKMNLAVRDCHTNLEKFNSPVFA